MPVDKNILKNNRIFLCRRHMITTVKNKSDLLNKKKIFKLFSIWILFY